MTVHDSSLASGSFPVTNMTPCLSHFWLLTPQLTHSLTKHADQCAYSFLYSAHDSSSLCLLICAYPLLTDRLQSLYCSLTNPPFFYKYCLLPPVYISCFWQSANASSQFPASKLFLRHPYLYIVLYQFASVSP